MPDPTQQVNALIAGEIDMIENVPHDLLPLLKADKNVQTVNWNPLGQQFIIRFNHLTKPFDNPKIRQAALLAMRQEDYLKATVGEQQYYKVCTAAFPCGTPNGVELQGDLLVKPNFEKAKALLKEAGYDGSPVVLMQSTTLPVLTNMAPVTKSLLEQAGFKVDMQSMDWQTVVTRRTKKDPANQGGWSAFHTYAIAADILNPISANGWSPTRQGVVRLAQRSGAGEAARRLRPRDRPRQEQGAGGGGAEPHARDGAVRLARHLVRTGRLAEQRRRLAQGAGGGALEHREEVTDQRLTDGARSDVRAPDGTRLAVYEWGKPAGPEVLLVHGFAQCHLCFEPQIRSAGRALPGRGVRLSRPRRLRAAGRSGRLPGRPRVGRRSRHGDGGQAARSVRCWSAGRWAGA